MLARKCVRCAIVVVIPVLRVRFKQPTSRNWGSGQSAGAPVGTAISHSDQPEEPTELV
jgi:hypothetical protein